MLSRCLSVGGNIYPESHTELSKQLTKLSLEMLKSISVGVNDQAGFSRIVSFAMGKRHEIIPGALAVDRLFVILHITHYTHYSTHIIKKML